MKRLEPAPVPWHDAEQLTHLYGQLRAPKGGWGLKGLSKEIGDAVDVPVGEIGVSLSILSKVARRLTRGPRVRHVAFHFADPRRDASSADLVKLAQKFGVDDLAVATLLEELSEAFDWIRGQDPRLREHLQVRRARADYLLADQLRSKREDAGSSVLRPEWNRPRFLSSLVANVNLLWQAVDQANAMLDATLDQVLDAAAQVAHRELSDKGQSSVSANIMLPVRNASAAAELLRELGVADGCPADAALTWDRVHTGSEPAWMVLAETGPDSHSGFWVPKRLPRRHHLPGAPEACETQTGSWVVASNPQSLADEDPGLNEQWRRYLHDKLAGMQFVSIPLMVPQIESQGKRICVAVLNVNATAENGGVWVRAGSREWLERVRRKVTPLLEVAHFLLLAKVSIWEAETQKSLGVDTGDAGWDTLPGRASKETT